MLSGEGNSDRHFQMSSLEYNAEYLVWNADAILTRNAIFHRSRIHLRLIDLYIYHL